MLSSYRNRPLQAGVALFGEVGLTGELRHVPFTAERVAEAARLGFSEVVLPAGGPLLAVPKGVTVTPLSGVQALADHLFD